MAALLSTGCPEDLREITHKRLHVVSPLVDIPVLAAIPTATAVCACAVTGVDPLPLLEAYPSVCADPTFTVELFIRFFTITDVCRDTPAVTVSWPLEFLSFLDSAVVACLPDHCLSSADQGGPWSAYVLLAGEVAAAAAPGDPFLREVPPQYLDALGEISAPVVPDLLEIIEALSLTTP